MTSITIIGAVCAQLCIASFARAQEQPIAIDFTCELALKREPEIDPKKERTKKCEQWSAKHKQDSAVATTSAVAKSRDNPVFSCLQVVNTGPAAVAVLTAANIAGRVVRFYAHAPRYGGCGVDYVELTS